MSAAVGKEMYRQWWFFIAALLFIVAVVERVYGIDRQSLWSDELYAVIASYKPFAGAWKMMVDDSHPPGYLSFMYATLPITGYSDFGVRLHALLFGLLWTPLVFWLTRRWFSMQAALLASAVIANFVESGCDVAAKAENPKLNVTDSNNILRERIIRPPEV